MFSRALGQETLLPSCCRASSTPFNSAHAGYKDWFIQTWRRPGYTIEAGQGVNPLPLSQFEEIYRANLPILVRGMALSP